MLTGLTTDNLTADWWREFGYDAEQERQRAVALHAHTDTVVDFANRQSLAAYPM